MSLQELITAKTRDELYAEEIVVAQEEGLATTAWQSGSVIRTILVIVAHMLSVFSSVIIEPIKGGFGDLLTSIGWAKLWAKQTYDVDAIEAEPATGYIDAVNASASEYIHAAGDLIVAHSVTGKLYRNVAAVTIAASATTEDILISSVEVGTSNNAAPDLITVLVGPAMSGVTITNPESVLGADDEKVAALVVRSRGKLAALSPLGPKDAYNYIVKTPEFCDTATPITRAETVADPATGFVSVYCATATGAPTAADVVICQDAIDEWAEPWCTTATAVAATEVELDVTYEVWVRSGLSETLIENAIADALAVFFEDTAIGGTVIPPEIGKIYVDSLSVVIATATLDDVSLGVVRASVTLPGEDTELEPNEVAVLGTVTATVNYL